jgi:hypothetical protein
VGRFSLRQCFFFFAWNAARLVQTLQCPPISRDGYLAKHDHRGLFYGVIWTKDGCASIALDATAD